MSRRRRRGPVPFWGDRAMARPRPRPACLLGGGPITLPILGHGLESGDGAQVRRGRCGGRRRRGRGWRLRGSCRTNHRCRCRGAWRRSRGRRRGHSDGRPVELWRLGRWGILVVSSTRRGGDLRRPSHRPRGRGGGGGGVVMVRPLLRLSLPRGTPLALRGHGRLKGRRRGLPDRRGPVSWPRSPSWPDRGGPYWMARRPRWRRRGRLDLREWSGRERRSGGLLG